MSTPPAPTDGGDEPMLLPTNHDEWKTVSVLEWIDGLTGGVPEQRPWDVPPRNFQTPVIHGHLSPPLDQVEQRDPMARPYLESMEALLKVRPHDSSQMVLMRLMYHMDRLFAPDHLPPVQGPLRDQLTEVYLDAIRQLQSCSSLLTPQQDTASILTAWLRENWTNPYPDQAGLVALTHACGATSTTVVSNWLINARTRKWRPAMVQAVALRRPPEYLLEDSLRIFDGQQPVTTAKRIKVESDDDEDDCRSLKRAKTLSWDSQCAV